MEKGKGEPINLGRYIIRPGRKLLAYSIDISENRAGILKEISNAIAERRGDILYLHAQVDERKGRRGLSSSWLRLSHLLILRS